MLLIPTLLLGASHLPVMYEMYEDVPLDGVVARIGGTRAILLVYRIDTLED